MRLALVVRHRLRLLMQSDLRPPAKRSFSQSSTTTAAAQTAQQPAKLPRTADSPHMASRFPRRRNPTNRSQDPGPSSSTPHNPSRSHKSLPTRSKKPAAAHRNLLYGPLHTLEHIQQLHNNPSVPLKNSVIEVPRSALNNFGVTVSGKVPSYTTVHGFVDGVGQVYRSTVSIEIEGQNPVIGVGDHPEKKRSVHLSALSACYQLQTLGILDKPKKLAKSRTAESITEIELSDGSKVDYDLARSFMDYYCRRYKFGLPEVDITKVSGDRWEAIMTVDGRRIGLGSAPNKKSAMTACYLDVTKYLESCDADLWKTYLEARKSGKDLGLAPKVFFHASPRLEEDISDLVDIIRHLALYRNRPQKNGVHAVGDNAGVANSLRAGGPAWRRPSALAEKSQALLKRREAYLTDPRMEKMRNTRAALPIYTKADEVLAQIAADDVTICMAATGSGKTTQIPQMILDQYIEKGEGAKCNIICTQPRRLAAISVADRVAKERGETLGQSIGYHVRFEAKPPESDGSVTFCTIGVFLKQLQTALSEKNPSLDRVTHVIVDEVHERDVDTDLLLVVLKQLLADKKAKGQSLKIILMSATIDPTLFQEYFPDDNGAPAKVVDIPGRSFPVTKHFMEEYVPKLVTPPNQWVFQEENVQRYITKELGPETAARLGIRVPTLPRNTEDLELPYALIAATISHVLQTSEEGHVLVFLPGWQEITATQKMLLSPVGKLGVDFNSRMYSIHLLHSSIPLAEQQAIFEPPAPGVRRIILATNIAETSITIPDVVYVIDAGKAKEQRYDPERHMSSLVSAWVGSSNLNQRAGRAGRHRSGEYYGILSQEHAEALNPYHTVEMKRVDLTNVVMHVKALNFSGMTVEEVLAAAIEPPAPERVSAAMSDLQMVGALDSEKNLTSLGRVLLQLPVDVQMGRLVLYGSFFKCLDNALALAAILTNRDPFMAPLGVKAIAQARKESWSPEGFRSDALATLRAFNAWWLLQSRGDYNAANRFCIENFLAKPTLLLIQKTKVALLQAMHRAGVIEVSAGGQFSNADARFDTMRRMTVPAALNVNGDSYPLLTALVSIACQPKFAIKTSDRSFRTPNDKVCIMHPSSVNQFRGARSNNGEPPQQKQLYAYAEKRRNGAGGSRTTYLCTTTRIDPLAYILFGAHEVEVVDRGLECDDWLPVVGDIRTLDDVQRLKKSIEACMLRVFEGITMSRQRGNLPVLPREEEHESESEGEDVDLADYRLSPEEVQDLDVMTRDIVSILNRYANERLASQSAAQSRAPTPMGSPRGGPMARLGGTDGGIASGYSTPGGFMSRPGTPSRLRKW